MPNVKIKNNRYVEPNVRNINKWFSQVVVKWYIIFRHGNWNKKKTVRVSGNTFRFI